MPSPNRGPVLVVDDDHDLRQAVMDLLDDAGYTPIGCGNGAEALQYLKHAADPPCLVLLDLMMPVMDGGAFLEVTGADPALSNIPVVVMTAVPDRSPSGVPCVAKPFTEEEILRVIADRCRCQPAVARATATATARADRSLPRRRSSSA